MTHARKKPVNARRTYGVLVGRVTDGRLKMAGNSPHYEIWVRARSEDFRVAVNVRSVDGSTVLVHYDPNYSAATKLDLPALAAGTPGFQPIANGGHGEGLDYVRDDLFDLGDMQRVPFGFSPERGVHDIHMMQGNAGAFADDSRINGDGALLRYAGGGTVALFIRFETQSIGTDALGMPA